MIHQAPAIRSMFGKPVDHRIIGKSQALYYNTINMLEIGGLSSIQKRFTLLGSTILITCYKNVISDFIYGYIDIDTDSPEVLAGAVENSLYMESGIFDMQANYLVECSEASYVPAYLKYTGWIAGYINSIEHPMQGKTELLDKPDNNGNVFKGEQIADETLSKSLGCSGDNRVDSISPCSIVFNGAPYYCEDLYPLKAAQRYLPASNFSGKLALMVQAIYGSKRRDYRLISAVLGMLSIGGFYIQSIYKPSYGLITTENYEFFIVKILNESTTYYPVRLSSVAEKFLDVARNNQSLSEDEVKKIEAYALSTAIIDSNNYIQGERVDVPLGIPLGYGWQWRWDGLQADVCVNYEEGTNYKRIFKHYRLSISYQYESDGSISFTETLTTVSTDDYWPIGIGLKLIKPIPALGTMLVVPLAQGAGTPIPLDESMDVTVHVFRDSSDRLNICRYKQDFELRYDSETNPQTRACWDSQSGAIYRDTWTNSGVSGTNSLQIGTDISSGSVSTHSSDQKQVTLGLGMGTALGYIATYHPGWHRFSQKITCNDGQTVGDYLLSKGYTVLHESGTLLHGTHSYGPDCSGNPVPIQYYFETYRVIKGGTLDQTVNKYSQDTQRFLMIPFNSSSSVISSVRREDSHDGIDHYEHTTGVSFSHDAWVKVVKKSYCNGVWTDHGIEETFPLSFINIAPTTQSYERIEPERTIQGIASVHNTSRHEIYNEQSTNNYMLSRYYDLVDTPLTESYDWVINSTKGDSRQFFNFVAYNEDLFPGHSSVGWV